VAPPTSRGHSSNAHHELHQSDFTIKTKNAGFTQSGKTKMAKQELKLSLALTHDFLTIV
jgi:hypothetical protein